MNNEKMNQIIDEAYENYLKNHPKGYYTDQHEIGGLIFTGPTVWKDEEPIKKEEFINKCKTDSEFSERWGLKIEERELSEKERIVLSGYDYENRGGIGWNMLKETVDMDNSIPTKLITVTYNDETVEIYE